MNSKFNKETSEGLYTFSGDEVFEALTMWCDKKGITLDKKSINFVDAKQINKINDNGTYDIVIEIGFNHRSKKED